MALRKFGVVASVSKGTEGSRPKTLHTVHCIFMNSGHILCELLECPSYNPVSAFSGVLCGEFL